ncbi:MAG TPA: YciI family protein [Bryobacteraceae bacterium]|jgi:hypothetical protein|nr:YciI family protein [Bryobacteraceae bacterium]
MRYMFLIYSQERSEPLAPEEARTLMDNHWAVMQDAREKGVLLGVDALKPTSTATTVRVNGGAMTTDGPFAETKEQLAGYYMLECKDLDDAIEWAKRIPTGCKGAVGCIEIRPVHELSRRP